MRMSSDRLLRGQKLARESAVLTAPRRLHNTKLDDFDMVKTIGTGERLFNVKSLFAVQKAEKKVDVRNSPIEGLLCQTS